MSEAGRRRPRPARWRRGSRIGRPEQLRCASTTCARACARSAPSRSTSSACCAAGCTHCRTTPAAPTTSCRARCATRCPRCAPSIAALATLRSRHPAADGSERLLVGLARRPDGGKRAAAARRPLRVDAGRLRGRLRVLHDGPVGGLELRQLGQRRDRGAGSRSRAGCGAVRRVVFMGMGEPAHNLDHVVAAIDLARHRRRHRPQGARVLDRRRPARVRGPRRQPRPARRWRCRCTRPTPALRRAAAARAGARPGRNLVDLGDATHAPPATRSSTSGPCSTASTTATTRSTASSRCSPASARS